MRPVFAFLILVNFIFSSTASANGNMQSIVDIKTQISGITIINNKLWIDGIEIKQDTQLYTSPITKITYKINWKQGNNISVEEVKK